MADRTYCVRPAADHDAPAIVALAARHHASLDEPTDRLTVEALRRDVFAADAPVRIVVACDDADRPIGFILWCFAYEAAYAARGGYVNDVFVSPEARRRGVGRALFAAAAADVRKEGGVFLWWTRREDNRAAEKFYAALGGHADPVIAHAVAFDAFNRLAAAGRDE